MPTTTDISTFTPDQQAAFKSAASLSGGQAQYSTSPISVTGMQNPPTPLNVPPAPTQPPPLSAEAIQAFISTPTSAQTTAQTSQNDLTKGLGDLYTQAGGESAKQTQLSTQAGIPDMQKQLQEINAQILQKNTGAFSATQASEGRLAPTFAITGEQAQIERERSAQTYGLAAASQVLQGNISLAKENVQNALDAEFKPLQAKIDYQMKLLELNKDKMSRADQEKASQLQVKLAEQKTQIDQQKGDKDTALALAAAAIKNNPSNTGALYAYNEVLKLSPSDPQYLVKVMGLVGKYQSDPIAVQKAVDDHLQSQASIRASNALATQRTTGGAAAGVSTALQQAIANGTIDPNKINSRTLGIYNSLAGAGIDAAGAHATISGNTKSYEDATRYATVATRVIGVLDKNMPLLANLADRVNQTGVPGLDNYIAGVKSYTGNNQDVVKYISTLKTLRSEYAQMLARGAATTVNDKEEAAQAIPAGLSGANYTSLQQQLKLEGQNIIQTANDVKNSLFSSTQSKATTSTFDSYANDINPASNGTDALIPRSVWTKVADKDGLLAYVKSLGFNLLVQ